MYTNLPEVYYRTLIILGIIMIICIIYLISKIIIASMEVLDFLIGIIKKILNIPGNIYKRTVIKEGIKEELRKSQKRRREYFDNPKRQKNIVEKRRREVDNCVKTNIEQAKTVFSKRKK